MIMALRTTFQPAAARGLSARYECHFGAVVINARIDDGALTVAAGPLPAADLVLTATGPINPLLTGALSPMAAIERGLVVISGDSVWLERFVAVFRIGAAVGDKEVRGTKSEVRSGSAAAGGGR